MVSPLPSVEFEFVGEGQSPPRRQSWVLIVKTHNQDFEVIVSFGDGTGPLTLGSDALLPLAQYRAQKAATDLRINRVYVIGAGCGAL